MKFERRDNLLVPKKSDVILGGVFKGEIVRDGRIIDRFRCKNLVVNQGLDSLLGVYLAGASQITNWYLGLFTGNYQPVASDTAATFPANATETPANTYTSATRIPFVPTEQNQQANNGGSPATFTFSQNATLYGAFLSSANGVGSTSGTLFSATQFASPKTVVAQDQLLLTYTVSAAST